jgi:hypothetical protein
LLSLFLHYPCLNYLSHYYVHQNENSPLYSLGLVFPDLSRGFVTHPGKLPIDNYGSLSMLALGCQQHFQADKIFHGSEFFKWGTEICIEILKKAKFQDQVERRWFIGHVLFEMLLDRILIRHKSQVGKDFYHDLNSVDVQNILAFIQLHSNKEPERFIRFFEHFRKAAYIRNYPDNNLFAFSLSRIMMKAGLPELSLSNKIVVQECVWELEENAFKNAQSILFELKEVFK